ASTSPTSITVTAGQRDSGSFNIIGASKTGKTRLVPEAPGIRPQAGEELDITAAPAINAVSSGEIGLGMQSSNWYVTLNSPAPPNGLKIDLQILNTDQDKVQIPLSVTVAAGQTSSPGFTVMGL